MQGPAESADPPRRILLYASDPGQFRRYEFALASAGNKWAVVPAYKIGRAFLDELKLQSADGVIFRYRSGETAVTETLQLLARERPDFPRFVICAAADRNSLKQPGGLPPVFLADDATSEELNEALTRTYTLARWLMRPELRLTLPKIQILPTIAGTYQQVIECLQDPDYSSDKVGSLISRDPGLTAQVLKIINSAYFALARSVQSVTEAVTMLGASRLQAMVMAARAFSFIGEDACKGFSPSRELDHAMAVAYTATELARTAGTRGSQLEAIFTASMLHDLGKLLLAANLPDRYSEVLADARARNIPLWQAELDAFHFTHAELGACLLGVWGLSLPIIGAVAWHHAPFTSPDSQSAPLLLVHAADCHTRQQPCDPSVAATLGIDPNPVSAE